VDIFRGIIGVLGFILIAYLFSSNKKAIRWKTVYWGIALQIAIGIIVLNPWVQHHVFTPINDFVMSLLGFANDGATFVLKNFVTNDVAPGMKNFAFWVLPTVIFFSAIMTLLYHFGVMQPIIRLIAKVMQKTMGTSGSESMSCSANIFVGQTEAPLMIKPFIGTMTKSELHAVMVGGFGTVAGGVMALYAATLSSIPGIAGHLVTASCMAAPGALYISKILYPETEESNTMGDLKMEVEKLDNNFIEATARGASEGMQLLINIVAMLVAFVAIVALLDTVLVKVVSISFTDLLSYVFAPFAWLMGIENSEIMMVGQLLGKKMVLTELLAYTDLAEKVAAGAISEKTRIVCSYALCGFANFASIGIQIGGIGGIAPQRRSDLAQMGLSAMFGGMLVTCITGTIAGIFMSFLATAH
jgi:CNT family concentrative nucleoside transporter